MTKQQKKLLLRSKIYASFYKDQPEPELTREELDALTENGRVVKVGSGGRLTLRDTGSDGTGRMTGGYDSENGGGNCHYRKEKKNGGKG